MRKMEFIAELAAEAGLTTKKANDVTKIFLEKIINVMEAGDEITFKGFGCFKAVETPERIYRNPLTGEDVPVGPRSNPKLKFSKKVKNRIHSK